MAKSPAAFLRFLAENFDLVLSIFERGEVDEAELLALIDRHRSDGQPSGDHMRRQLADLGVVEKSAHADTASELAQPVVDLLAWLTHQQRLSSATVLQAHLVDLTKIGHELGDSIRRGDPSGAALVLRELHGTVERVRSLSQANRESIVTEAQALRSARAGISAVDRFLVVRRLWQRHLEPLRDLVSVQGEMDQRLDGLQTMLGDGEQRFLAHGAVSRGFSQAIARLTRMRRDAAEDHHAAVVEIAPLYEKLRRESRWVLGASRALARLRVEGADSLDLDRRMGLTGWRGRYLISDQKLRARLAGLVGYAPANAPVLADSPPLPGLPLITRDELRATLKAAAPVRDVLEQILSRWPDQTLAAQLRAFGLVASGGFGTISVAAGSQSRTYQVPLGSIEAWPLSLEDVIA